jgi:hypothetical protein
MIAPAERGVARRAQNPEKRMSISLPDRADGPALAGHAFTMAVCRLSQIAHDGKNRNGAPLGSAGRCGPGGLRPERDYVSRRGRDCHGNEHCIERLSTSCCQKVAVSVTRMALDPSPGNSAVQSALEIAVSHFKKLVTPENAPDCDVVPSKHRKNLACSMIVRLWIFHRHFSPLQSNRKRASVSGKQFDALSPQLSKVYWFFCVSAHCVMIDEAGKLLRCEWSRIMSPPNFIERLCASTAS